MKNLREEIVYVGKAKVLRKRVCSYFVGIDSKDSKTKALVKEICDFEVILTELEEEALLLERNLIRHHSPRYNVIFKDGKEYPLVRVDYNEEWPRIEKVRKKLNDGAYYIGPFSHGGHLYTSLKVLDRVFPLVRCSRHEFKNAKRPCNYFHMGQCLGPCTLPVDREEYVRMIQRCVSVLKGNHADVTASLKEDMQRASSQQQFEKAAQHRDQIKALAAVNNRQTVVLDEPIDVDVIAFIANADGDIVMSMLFLRMGKVIGHENFSFATTLSTVFESIESFLTQYYGLKEIPGEIHLPIDYPDTLTLQKTLTLLSAEKSATSTSDKLNSKPVILQPQRGPKAKLMDMAMKNALFFQTDKAKSSENRRRDLEQLMKDLNLPVFPTRIECLDISNMSGQSVVGAISCFIDARPAKKHYRRYKIKTLNEGEQNDFASVFEVTVRRLKHAVDEDDFPDLLVIDGGKAQLGKALEARTSLNLSRPYIVSLAKARSKYDTRDTPSSQTTQIKAFERVFLPGATDPIVLKEASPSFRILTQIRDEAHRFVIAYHRQKRSEKTFKSDFDDIIGVGPVLRKRLQLAFGTLEAVYRATDAEILAVKGIRPLHLQSLRAGHSIAIKPPDKLVSMDESEDESDP